MKRCRVLKCDIDSFEKVISVSELLRHYLPSKINHALALSSGFPKVLMSKLRNSNIQAVACVGEEEAKHGDNSTIEAG